MIKDESRNSELPAGYKKGVERVSRVVESKFPFTGNTEKRFKEWLEDDVPEPRKRGFSIDKDEYMDEASKVGTFIHEQMEFEILGKKQSKSDSLYDKHLWEIEHGLSYIKDLKSKYPSVKWLTEVVVLDDKERFQGSMDLVRVDEESKTVWLYDWKTWGVAKKKWGLINTTTTKLKSGKRSYKKNASKLKKVALQLSLYAETYRQKGYSIGGIYVVHLHEEGAFELGLTKKDNPKDKSGMLKLWSKEEIDKLLIDFKLKENIINKLSLGNLDLNINIKSDMILEIRVPTGQYAYLDITIDMYKEEKGVTLDDKIIEAKQAINKYLENEEGTTGS